MYQRKSKEKKTNLNRKLFGVRIFINKEKILSVKRLNKIKWGLELGNKIYILCLLVIVRLGNRRSIVVEARLGRILVYLLEGKLIHCRKAHFLVIKDLILMDLMVLMLASQIILILNLFINQINGNHLLILHLFLIIL